MRNTLLVVLFVISGLVSLAQDPFSYYGLGETSGYDHPILSGIGNTEITLIDSTTLNYYNPASYNALGVGQPIFSIGLSSRLSNYTQGDTKEFASKTGIQHFAFGFSFAKHFGIGLGLRPYALRNYDLISGENVGTDSITYRYFGSGGLSETFVGFSAELLPFLDSTSLSVGGNLGWLFGNVSHTRQSWLSNSANNTGGVGINTTDVRSIHYDFGFYFKHYINANHEIGLFATIDPSQGLKASYTEGIFQAGNVNNPNGYDTASFIEQSGLRIQTAPEFTYGLSYSYMFKDSKSIQRRLHPVISLHASYSTIDWSKYNDPYNPSSNYLKSSKLTAGIQFVPEGNLQFNSSKTNIFEQMKYRVGFYSYTLPYAINNIQVSDFGTTFGFGVPVTIGKSLSSVNLGLSLGQRGTSDASQMKENYYGINFGISIAPAQNERWFQKRRVN